MLGLHIIWFRRDLRVHDHAALKAAHLAAERDHGLVLPLFVGSGPTSPELSAALKDLDEALAGRGAALHFRTGNVIEALTAFHTAHHIASIHAHADPDDRKTERAVETWSVRAGVPFRLHDAPGQGDKAWVRDMSAPRHEGPVHLKAANVGLGHKLYASGADDSGRAAGGRKAAVKLLRSLLGQLSDLSGIAAPEARAADPGLAALDAHLQLGVLSVREVWQAASAARHQYMAAGQDIRAARLAGLLEHLQKQFQRGGHGQDGSARRAQVRGVSNPDARARRGAQLSLDLFAP